MVNIHSPLSSKLRYFFSLGSLSNFVYLFYAAFILAIDFGASVDTFSFLTSAPARHCAQRCRPRRLRPGKREAAQ
jgi:hypothetical protein